MNPINESRALRHLMDLLRVEGLSGREGKVAALVRKKLLAAGCKPSWIRHDRAHKKIGDGYEIGNMIVRIPGTTRAPRRLFMSHLDTVPLCRGTTPVRKGNRIVAKKATALGADNRTGVACMVTLVEALLKHGLPRPPLTALFTVGEEVGLRGARHVSLRDLGQPRIGFNIDSGDPRVLVVGATGADRWEVDVVGRSSHAGVHPEDGVSAVLIASRAIAEVAHKGYFGKVRKGRREGTSNVGAVRGGEATNQVTDRVHILGESRSHQPAFRREITAVYRRAFEKAARSVRSEDGRAGRVRFSVKPDYESYRLGEETPVVRLAMGQVRSFRWKPGLLVVNGGTDANYLNAKGVPTVTLGAGAHHAHTVEEHADIKEYLGGCRLALALAQTSEP